MKEQIRQRAVELGFDACRFAAAHTPSTFKQYEEWIQAGCHGTMSYLERNLDRRADPTLVVANARTVLSLAASYPSAQPPEPKDRPTGRVARYAQATDYHDTLAAPLRELALYIEDLGGPGTLTRPYVDTGPILERSFGQESGLGFVGKHTNLISRQLGNWFFLAEILTTLELDPDPPEPNRCGTCSRCIDACPTRAITAPFQLDARRCISYLTIELKGSIPEDLRPAIGNRVFGCDDCLEVCPWNRFAREGRLMRQVALPELQHLDLLELLSLDTDTFRQRFRHTPLWRGKQPRLLRNVCVALGNTAGPEALPALEQAALHPEPLVQEHALWAIQTIRQRHL
ncbi:MAG: tRNA epoxyqueuosine(34) reductase QueG [Verrucomicrobiota bacterium]